MTDPECRLKARRRKLQFARAALRGLRKQITHDIPAEDEILDALADAEVSLAVAYRLLDKLIQSLPAYAE